MCYNSQFLIRLEGYQHISETSKLTDEYIKQYESIEIQSVSAVAEENSVGAEVVLSRFSMATDTVTESCNSSSKSSSIS